MEPWLDEACTNCHTSFPAEEDTAQMEGRSNEDAGALDDEEEDHVGEEGNNAA